VANYIFRNHLQATDELERRTLIVLVHVKGLSQADRQALIENKEETIPPPSITTDVDTTETQESPTGTNNGDADTSAPAVPAAPAAGTAPVPAAPTDANDGRVRKRAKISTFWGKVRVLLTSEETLDDLRKKINTI